jgi:transaldolase/transaldolase/glucose-6-phosphate isomerase
MSTPLQQVDQLGQSVWIDWISRDLLDSAGLSHLVERHGVTGVTTNPTILEQAIADGAGYDRHILDLLDHGLTPDVVATELAARDVSDAATQLLPVWHDRRGRDGYVSWEVDPDLAWNAAQTLGAVERIHRRIDLPNLLVKIPATEAGVEAFEDATAGGWSINVTLIFSLERYAEVAQAYVRGLRRAAEAGLDLSMIHSVASFFVSRLDTAADELLVADGSPTTAALRGTLGIATAKLAYRHFRSMFSGRDWADLRLKGARIQRLLWASTSTKNPAYSDVRYVEELIGGETVTTLAKGTLRAFEHHGRVGRTLAGGAEAAAATLGELAAVGIDVRALADYLERDGIRRFAESRDGLAARIEAHHRRLRAA